MLAPNRRKFVCPHARIVPVLSREIEFSAQAHVPPSFSFGGEGGRFFGVEVAEVVIVVGDEF